MASKCYGIPQQGWDSYAGSADERPACSDYRVLNSGRDDIGFFLHGLFFLGFQHIINNWYFIWWFLFFGDLKFISWNRQQLNSWLVVSTPLKNSSQWEGLSHILWKIKHVWNHHFVHFDLHTALVSKAVHWLWLIRDNVTPEQAGDPKP